MVREVSYSLEHDEAVIDGIRRICREQADKAIEALGSDAAQEPHTAIHECRKRCKKIRGAVRLVRPAVGDDEYQRVNRLARDAARELSEFRDARALAETFDRLRDVVELDRDQMSTTQELLDADQLAAEAELQPEHPAVQRSRALLAELVDAIDDLSTKRSEWDAIAPGLVTTYQRGRTALDASIENGTGETFHEWRKRAKYTRYHLSLITTAAPDLLDPLETAFHHLTDALGDAHDLYVLEQRLAGVDDIDGARLLVAGARADLERRAVRLGRRLYAESAKRFEQRLGAYWAVWRSEPADVVAGSLGRVYD